MAVAIISGLLVWSTMKVETKLNPQVELAATEDINVTENETDYEVVSPDGKYSLSLNNKGSDLIHQTVILQTVKDSSTKILLEKSASKDSLLTVPSNTFSPDDKYIFLKDGADMNTKYLVLRTDSKNLKGETKSAEIISLFYAKYTDFVVTDATGWGGIGVIVVNTDYKNGKIGPSFWFEPASLGFIRLNTRFN